MESFVDGDGAAPTTASATALPAQRRSAGIIDSLDHIKSLNVNAIWLTPVFDSCAGQAGDDRLDATGYFACDFFNVDPNFGSNAKLKTGGRAHQRGLYVFLDGVFGHVNKVGVSKPSPGAAACPQERRRRLPGSTGGLRPARESGLLQGGGPLLGRAVRHRRLAPRSGLSVGAG